MTTIAANTEISWLKFGITVVLTVCCALAVMIACAYAWVFIYSIAIYSSGDAHHYQDYAQFASPVAAVVTAFPVFYFVGRYWRKYGERAVLGALAAVMLNLSMDAVILTTVSDNTAYLVTMSILAAIGKIGGAYIGATDGRAD